MLGRQLPEGFALGPEQAALQISHCTHTCFRHVYESPVEVRWTSCLNELNPYPQRPSANRGTRRTPGGRGDREAKLSSRLQVDGENVFCRVLYGEIARSCPLQDLVHIPGQSPKL